MQSSPVGRGVEIATAIALGVVTLVTALGVLQASVWNSDAARFASDSADARDQGVSLAVVAQLKARDDLGAVYEAKYLAERQDAAIAAGQVTRALELELEITGALGTAYNIPAGAFDAWRSGGFAEDANPARSPEYLVEGRGGADALKLTAQRLAESAASLTARAAIFAQASVVHALALFLFGVAGINRLRAARYVTLVSGAGVFLFGLVIMATAY